MTQNKTQRIIENVQRITQRDGVGPYELSKIMDTSNGGKVGFDQYEKALATSSLAALKTGQNLNPDQVISLEKILYPTLRPSADITYDTFDDLDSNWNDVNEARPALVPLIKGIGRVSVKGNPLGTVVGTAFIVGENVLMTNRHVAEVFVSAPNESKELSFKPGMSAKIDLKQEVAIPDSIVLDVVAPVQILHQWDVAIFEIASSPTGVTPLPLCSRKPAIIENKTVVTIGYPSYDPDEDSTAQSLVFRNTYSKKRIMPGKVNGLGLIESYGTQVNALMHDCSTLGGNSGSAVIDIELGQVTGLHFLGSAHVSNYAVPLWELASIPEVKSAGVIFA
ncbi:serine protease [Massilia sp. 2TAF26]|uniref:trypsin-like serine peptidase n=1 Tax=Massilia sp. 2TAF26 TaxID=3233012 RepID=UPI003F9A06EF